MAHDFKRFPELTNGQMQFYYFDSPHPQITEDIRVSVIKIHDGDTITVRWDKRSFDFPVRFANVAAPELNESGGHEAQSWLESQILDEEITLEISPKRVEKWGRLLANIRFRGMDMGELEIWAGHATTWDDRNRGKIIDPIPRLKPN